jgi:hypothetical protein
MRPVLLLLVWVQVWRRLHLVLLLELRRRRLVLLLLLLAGGGATQHLSLQLLSRHCTLQQQWPRGHDCGHRSGAGRRHIHTHSRTLQQRRSKQRRAGKAGSPPKQLTGPMGPPSMPPPGKADTTGGAPIWPMPLLASCSGDGCCWCC